MAQMYEDRGRQGRRVLVPTYRAVVACDRDPDKRFEFAVTRDSSALLFGKQIRRYDTNGECPPSSPAQPYLGRIREDGAVGFCIQLYEPWCERQESIRGSGDTLRRHILIHFGPAASCGCFLIGGGKRGYERFIKRIRAILCDLSSPLHVVVLERSM